MNKVETSIILTQPQQKIMDIIWASGGATARSIYKIISNEKKITYFAINTMLRTLEKKGVLDHSNLGNIYFFRPLLTRRQVINSHIGHTLDDYFDNIPEKLIEFIIQNSYGTTGLRTTDNLLKRQHSHPNEIPGLSRNNEITQEEAS